MYQGGLFGQRPQTPIGGGLQKNFFGFLILCSSGPFLPRPIVVYTGETFLQLVIAAGLVLKGGPEGGLTGLEEQTEGVANWSRRLPWGLKPRLENPHLSRFLPV